MKFSKEEKINFLEEWKQSGKSAWAFTREKGINGQTFANWIKKEKEAKSGFVEIKPKKPLFSQVSGIIIERGGIKIHLPLEMSSKDLRKVIESLEGSMQRAAV